MPQAKPKTAEELERMRESCKLLSQTMAEVAKVLRPGITGFEIDKLAETFIRDHGASPSFKNYNGFPASLCISVNDAVVHGIPGAAPYRDGDIVSVDCGVFLNGFHGDMAYTYGIGNVKEETQALMRTTKEALYLGIEQAVANNRTGDIGFAIQHYCEKKGYSIVRELVGHGLGRTLHEEPQVPNFGKRGSGQKLLADVVIAIEPMINLGKKNVYTQKDDWTVATQDGKPSAHYEHTVRVMTGKAEVLTTFEWIEQAVAANPHLLKI